MSHEEIVDALLRLPSIADIVGDRVALKMLPHGTPLPAIAYDFPTGTPWGNHDRKANPKAVVRVQINPIAPSPEQVKEVHARVQNELDLLHNTVVAGKLVISCRMALVGPWDADTESENWTQPVDYLLTYAE